MPKPIMDESVQMHSGQADKTAVVEPKRTRYGRILRQPRCLQNAIEFFQKKGTCVDDNDDHKLVNYFNGIYYIAKK